MVDTLVGNLFESKAQTLVNTVNCVGVMGKGVALEFKKRFPQMYEDYLRRCAAQQVRLGEPYLFRQVVPPWILNFPTKGHWRSVSRLSDIVSGLRYLERRYREWGITSLAVPPLGCGHGQLEWRVVGPTLYRHLSRFAIPVELYAPYGTPPRQLAAEFLLGNEADFGAATEERAAAKVEPSLVALVEVIARIEREPCHWPVGRTTFQKIAYFVTQSGIPTGLTYVRGSYGPFAAGLKSSLTRLVNNGLVQEEQLGRMFRVKPGPTYPDAAKVYEAVLRRWDQEIEQVADLFLRMHTREAEVAATVLFCARELASGADPNVSEEDVLAAVLAWKQKRRPSLARGEIAEAIRRLNILRWIDARPSVDLPVALDPLIDDGSTAGAVQVG